MFTLNKKSIIGCAALLMALAACSNTDDKPLSELGGASEETEVIADQDTSTTEQDSSKKTTHIKKTIYFRTSATKNSFFSDTSVSMSASHPFDLAMMYELDSTNMIETGNAVLSINPYRRSSDPNAAYQFQFDSIPFKSPYVIIELGYRKSYSGIATKRAMVDLRDAGNIYINTLTDFVSYRMNYGSLNSKNFADKKRKTEAELLNALGVYDTLYDFEKENSFNDSNLVFIENALSQLVQKDEENELIYNFLHHGNFEGVTYVLLDTLLKYITNIEKIDLEIVNRAGEPWATPFYEQQRLNQFYINLVAAMHKAGQCTNAEEGKMVKLDKENLHVICRSGAWKIIIKPIPHSFDSIVDPRDGNVYKTVTIDMDGTTQTWMAEDLAYAADGSHCSRELFEPYDKDPFYCKYYGREYTLQTALGIDSSFYRLPNFDECAEIKAAYCYQSCIDSVVDYLDSVRNSMSFKEFSDIEYTPEYDFERLHNKCTFECNSISDTAAFMSACESDERKIDWEKLQNVTDKTKMRGICPDGWRIPSAKDWNKWIELFEKTYNFTYPENDNDNHLIFFSTFGDPSGFGMHPIVLPEPYYAKDEEHRAYFDPFYTSDPYVSFTTWPSNGSEGMSTIASIPANKNVLSYSFNISWPGTLLMIGGIPESRDSFHVRCIKNE
ncbi:MAG: hypothetical protein J6W22_12840 [Fibrobacter sp.]|nr:hypothetical protein [Fibrobacter sp.]